MLAEGFSMPRKTNLPLTETELLAELSSNDPFVLVVRGHQFLESMMNLAVSEALPISHEVEVSRLTFPLKVDLAIALRVLPTECRVGYMKINRLRNRFAHDHTASLTRRAAREAYNALSVRMRDAFGRESDSIAEPSSLVRRCIQILFVVLEISVTSMRDERVRERVVMDLAEETHQRVSKRWIAEDNAEDPYYSRVNERIETRVREERERRQALGDP